MKNIIVFASGSGTNAENLFNYFKKNVDIRISAVFTNNPKAGVIDRAKLANIPVVVFNRHEFYENETVLQKLRDYRADYIVLAGFLWLVPASLIKAYPQRILNLHPALLPLYGGKGMYGMNVHRAVIADEARQSGITIHEVDSEYDRGRTIFQTTCDVAPFDTPESLAGKIHVLEYRYLPEVVEKWVEGKIQDL